MSVPRRDPGGRAVGAYRDLGAAGSPDGGTGRLVGPVARRARARPSSREPRAPGGAAPVAPCPAHPWRMRFVRDLRRALAILLLERGSVLALAPAHYACAWRAPPKAFALTP